MPFMNRQMRLRERPYGLPRPENFGITESPVPPTGEGQVLLKTLYLSVDPYMRGRMRDVKSYAPPFPLHEVIVGGAVAQVVESRRPNLTVGQIVVGTLGWQDYSLTDGRGLRVLDPDRAPVTTALGVLGMPGLTAYFGLLEVGRPRPGDMVVVSAASGAVGSVVGQLAKIAGCQVVGIAGASAKTDYLIRELGFDGALNRRDIEGLPTQLAQACPRGIDVYFDNVGGPVTDAVIPWLNVRARVVVCGQIAAYNNETPDIGPRPWWQLVTKRARVQGFLVGDFAHCQAEALAKLSQWYEEGRLRYRETVINGLENAPRALIGLFEGANFGKQLVKVSDS